MCCQVLKKKSSKKCYILCPVRTYLTECLAMMDLENKTSQLDDAKSTDTHNQSDPFLAKITTSPLMFDDDIISNGIQTQPDGQSYTFNQLISTQKSALPSQWTANFKVPSLIESTGYTVVPIHHQTDTIFLSVSHIENVTICGLCDSATNFDENSNDCHNRTVTDVTGIDGLKGNLDDDDFVGSELGTFPKRARLNQTPGVAPDISLVSEAKTSAEAFDLVAKLAESTKAINDHMRSLHEDCDKHLTMAKNIIGAMDI